MKDLKLVYQAATEESALQTLDELEKFFWGMISAHPPLFPGEVIILRYALTLNTRLKFIRLFIRLIPLKISTDS